MEKKTRESKKKKNKLDLAINYLLATRSQNNAKCT